MTFQFHNKKIMRDQTQTLYNTTISSIQEILSPQLAGKLIVKRFVYRDLVTNCGIRGYLAWE